MRSSPNPPSKPSPPDPTTTKESHVIHHARGLDLSAWDNTPGLRYIAPTAAAAEDAAAGWLLDLLGLPTGSDVGFATGATKAGFTGLMAGRFQVLADTGRCACRLPTAGRRTWLG
jgi:glutamate/tyrosine decarboxylase-like PLP-dependent enzyme